MITINFTDWANALNQNPRSVVLPDEPFQVTLEVDIGKKPAKLSFTVEPSRAQEQIASDGGSWGVNGYTVQLTNGTLEFSVTNTGNY